MKHWFRGQYDLLEEADECDIGVGSWKSVHGVGSGEKRSGVERHFGVHLCEILGPRWYFVRPGWS